MRYLLAVDDDGKEFIPSADPLLEELQSYLTDIKLGCNDTDKIHTALKAILSNKEIFTCDLYEAGIAEKVESLFLEMIKEPGAVRATIKQSI